VYVVVEVAVVAAGELAEAGAEEGGKAAMGLAKARESFAAGRASSLDSAATCSSLAAAAAAAEAESAAAAAAAASAAAMAASSTTFLSRAASSSSSRARASRTPAKSLAWFAADSAERTKAGQGQSATV